MPKNPVSGQSKDAPFSGFCLIAAERTDKTHMICSPAKLSHLPAFTVSRLPSTDTVALYLAAFNAFVFCGLSYPPLNPRKPLASKPSCIPLLSHVWFEEPPFVCFEPGSCPLQPLMVCSLYQDKHWRINSPLHTIHDFCSSGQNKQQRINMPHPLY